MINVPQVHVAPSHAWLKESFQVSSSLCPALNTQQLFGRTLQKLSSFECISVSRPAPGSNLLLRGDGSKHFWTFFGILLSVLTLLLFVFLVPLSASLQSLFSLLHTFLSSLELAMVNGFLHSVLNECRVFAPALQICFLTLSACLLQSMFFSTALVKSFKWFGSFTLATMFVHAIIYATNVRWLTIFIDLLG